MSNKIEKQVIILPQTDDVASTPKEVKIQSHTHTPAGALDGTNSITYREAEEVAIKAVRLFSTASVPFPDLSPGEAIANIPKIVALLPQLDIETMIRDVENYNTKLANAPTIEEKIKIIGEINSNVEAMKAKTEDAKVAQQAKALFESGDTAGATKALQTYVNSTIAKVGKENVPEGSMLRKPLVISAAGADGITTNGVLDITAIILKIMQALDQLRLLNRDLSAKQRQNALTLSLKAADETRKAGHEKMVAGVVAGALGIVAGVATIGGAVYAVGAGAKAGAAARETAETEGKFEHLKGDDLLEALNKHEGAEMSRTIDRLNTMTQAGSGIVKTSGELGSGIQQTAIAGREAQGQEYSAYAQNTTQQADTTKENAADLLNRLLSSLETLSKLMETKNRGVESVINKI